MYLKVIMHHIFHLFWFHLFLKLKVYCIIYFAGVIIEEAKAIPLYRNFLTELSHKS